MSFKYCFTDILIKLIECLNSSLSVAVAKVKEDKEHFEIKLTEKKNYRVPQRFKRSVQESYKFLNYDFKVWHPRCVLIQSIKSG